MMLRFWDRLQSSWIALACVFWLAIILGIGTRVFLNPASRTTYPIFSASARLFWHSDELYFPHRPESVQGGYRYPPTFALLASPFAIFPDSIGGGLWRGFNLACYLGALLWWGRSVLPGGMTNSQLALLSILTIPLALPSVNNGQVNILVTGMLLATVACVAEKRWNLASIVMAVAFVCKLYPLALGMILIVLYPRQLLLRMSFILAGSLAIPYLCQNSDYVTDQYAKWASCLKADDRSMFELDGAYRDLWLLIRLFELPIPFRYYQLGQVASGACIAGLCWFRQRRGWPERDLLISTLALATTWMMLLGPSPESCTFVLLAPSLSWSFYREWQTRQSMVRLSLVTGSCLLFGFAFMSGWLPDATRLHGKGFHVYATLLFMIHLLFERPSAHVPEAESIPIPPIRLAA